MATFKKSISAAICILIIASCSSGQRCDCEVPGSALVKVFMADDGIPNVNIETVDVYPGQKLEFRGLAEFSLTFARDPQNPRGKDKTYKSKDGSISLKISKEYDDIFKGKLDQQGAGIVRAASNDQKEAVDYIYIKYDVTANGKTRDPGVKVIPK